MRAKMMLTVLMMILAGGHASAQGPTIGGSVYGGGNLADVGGNVTVNISAGTVDNDVYGGGAKANTNTGNWDFDGGTEYVQVNVTVDETVVTGMYTESGGTYTKITAEGTKAVGNTTYYKKVGVWKESSGTTGGYIAATETTPSSTYYKTTVNLLGGTITGNAYGGGLGEGQGATGTPAYVYGDVKVNLNGLEAATDIDETTLTTLKTGNNARLNENNKVKTSVKGCAVTRVFGCNNLNGTPKGHVKVNVYATQNSSTTSTSILPKGNSHTDKETGTTTTYDVTAVYGGGNLSPYDPVDAYSTNNDVKLAAKTEVLIDGCGLTSIKQVYGGGNAASAPATYVRVDGTFEIEELFGGGNGNDDYQFNGKWYKNPGANVGYTNYTHLDGNGDGSTASPYTCVDNDNAKTKAGRQTEANGYMYGSGIAQIEVFGGKIFASYGGSNKKGNVRVEARSKYEEAGDCALDVVETYGGGKDSEIDGVINLNVGCVKNMDQIFGGSKNAPVYSDIVLNIHNGHYHQVFGGNNTSGAIHGSITVNIEENGCVPIDIDELYIGGYLAPYSIYGYKNDGTPLKEGDTGALETPYKQPRLNVISASRIGDIFGGGYQATVVGDPHVNVNMEAGKVEVKKTEITAADAATDEYAFSESDKYYIYTYKYYTSATAYTEYKVKNDVISNISGKYYAPLTLGTIENVYGGGNEANIVGDTYVEIGTGKWLKDGTDDVWETKDATGNTYTFEKKGTDTAPKWYKGDDAQESAPTPRRKDAKISGDVFGGGQGVNTGDATDVDIAKVEGNTNIQFDNGTIAKSVYGGGKLAQVSGTTTINITGGTATTVIGTTGEGGATYGNVYGGGFGHTADKLFGRIMGNTNVNISGGAILHNVYGGGAYGSVGTFSYDTEEMPSGLSTASTGTTNVTITGGTIGTNGVENGMVFGSSRGDVATPTGTPAVDPNDKLAWVYDANVIIGTSGATTGPQINGSVYGSGENGHTYRNTDIKIYSGTIGINSSDNVTIYDLLDNTKKVYEGKAHNYSNRGNVYGGGCGTDMYDSNSDGTNDTYNPLAGVVQGTTSVTITGGTVVHNVYGAGALGSVGRTTTASNGDITINSGGTTTIAISGGTVGVDGDGNGNVFGAARGDSISTQTDIALVKTTNVTISGSAQIKGNVYGGGQAGDVGTYHTVSDDDVTAGADRLTKGNNNYLGGDASGVCNVVITGGTIGTEGTTTAGHVFGAGKGAGNTYTCQKAMVKETSVTISNGTIYGDVYGGGEVGRVEHDATVTIGLETLADGSTIYYEKSGDTYSEATVTAGTTNVVGKYIRSGVEGSYVYIPIVATATDVPTIHGNVFGAGAGMETHGYSALVRGNSTVTIGGYAAVRKNVYGGGKAATVGKYWVSNFSPDPNEAPPTGFPDGMPYKTRDGGFCRVTIQGQATIGPASGDASEEAGQVFGAGKGVNPRSYTFTGTDKPSRMNEGGMEPLNSPEAYFQFLETLALASNTVVTIGGATIKGSVFGGSESGFVQDHTTVTVNSGTIGTATTETYGNVFGGGKGIASFAEAGRVRGNTTVAFNGGTAYGSVYGGGKYGDVGTINKEDPNMNYKWTDATGSNLGEDYTYNNTGMCIVTVSGGEVKKHVFGAGKGEQANSFECERAMVYRTRVIMKNGKVNGNVYGGGEIGRVENNTAVMVGLEKVADGTTTYYELTNAQTQTYSGSVPAKGTSVVGKYIQSGVAGSYVYTLIENATSAPEIVGSVFGAGAGVDTHGYSALVRNNSSVTVQGSAKVRTSVYGGGQIATVGKYWVTGVDYGNIPHPSAEGLNLPDGMPYANRSGGECTVIVQGQATIGPETGTASETAGHVFGAGKGVEPHFSDGPQKMTMNGTLVGFSNNQLYLEFLESLALVTTTHVTIDGATVKGSVYGGSESGFVQTDTDVRILNGVIGTTGTTTYGDVYGGGKGLTTFAEAGRVKGNTTVTIVGGITNGSVYGGAALAKSNTESTTTTGANPVTTYPTSTVNLFGGVITGDAYGGGKGNASNAADVGVAKVNLNGMSLSEYNTLIASLPDDAYKTLLTSILTPLDVNGDGDTTDDGVDYYIVNTGTKGCTLDRIFGANNTNGTPKGDVTVHVYATQSEDSEKTTIAKKFFYYYDNYEDAETTNISAETDVDKLKGYLHDQIRKAGKLNISTSTYQDTYDNASDAAVVKTAIANLSADIKEKIDDPNTSETQLKALYDMMYDVRAVYGGGNEAVYNPASFYTTDNTTGSRSQVIIDGCDLTSIEMVYGGGNAAAVPESNVTVNAAYEIYNVYGGGNGKDATSYGENPGADVGTPDHGATTYGTGNANSTLKGGYIHEAYGGSNQNGIIKGSINQSSDPDGSACELMMDKVVGAGKYADIDGDVNMTLDCQPNKKVVLLFAGADEANVNGNITLNITNGRFGQVFGGNNLGGAIKGKITVNVEETGCQPIKIDNLYLGSNKAAYSVFGYYESDEVHPVTGKKILKPRVSEDDEHTPVANPATDETHTFPYAQPELNIISCTYIGNVFGGGLGAPATMYASPSVNINMVQGRHAAPAVPAMMTELNLPNSENTNHLGIIENVYGGGDAAPVIGETHVNIGTEQTVGTSQTTVLGAYITGNVYGGGKLANVGEMDADIDQITAQGRTFVNIGAKKTTVNNQEVWQAVAAGKSVTIKGNVYGGGKGEATTFKCEKAIVAGSTNIMIGNGTVKGTVYGGGQLGRVETGTTVTIGIGDGEATGTPGSEPQINGNVYGAGAGVNTHGYAALVRGISEVTIQGNAKVDSCVYGGGQIASVGRYKVKKGQGEPSDAPDDVEIGMPYTLADSNSKCIVTVKGYAEIGLDNMQMKATGGPDDTGYVFGAGKGVLPYEGYAENEDPVRWTIDDDGNYVKEEYEPENEDLYLKYVGTLALATETEVTIGGHAFVKGSVYGGSENGHVQHDTNVKIEGNCQIGNGWNTTTNTGVNERYNENLFVNPATATAQEIETAAASIYECAHWDYTDPYTPYDKNGAAGGGATTATDGHTFYGNVFGGGSGLYPYKSRKYKDAADNYIFEWLRTAGRVVGNTNVIITGGHILTSVYGGCELTDVGNGVSVETNKGRCFVKMSGGTLGVPRTLAQIAAHPVTCYLFGAGKGDQRVHFNQWTNVGKVRVEINDSISQPIIYGSAFGGGEDGHVLGDVSIDIKTMNGNDPVIGTWGTSYVDGNVFGGGRGFGGDALTAGVVSGNVYINISGGKMLGSIYGGGRLGSVGTYLVPSDKTQKYGQFIPDGKQQTIHEETIGNGDVVVSDATGVTHGHVTINISGGTIGNRYEYAYYAPNTTIDKSTNHIPYTEFDATSNRLTHTKGGNVFAGAMGRFYGLDGSTVLPRWIDLGKVKSTKLNISGSAVIKSSIYGGGELGWTSGTHKTSDNKDVSTEISITGGTIGSEITDNNVVQYTYGSVFGGGYGNATEMLTDANSNKTYPKFQAGRVMNSTAVTMSSGTVKASVYGGGELANVGYGFYSYSYDGLGETAITQASDAANTYVTVSGGTIGRAPITAQTGNTYFGGATMGNVYGGGSGNKTITRCGLVLGNTNVNISGTTRIYHNIYGGGAYGSVGDYEYTTGTNDPNYPDIVKVFGINSLHTSGTGTANVTITGGTIGYDGKDNGMVFGSSRGDVQGEDSRDDYMAWVNDAFITIGTSSSTDGPHIRGSVYGSGENGHVFHDTDVKIYSGTIGIDNADTSVEGYTVTSSGTTYNGPEYPSRGNVYGGGCGTDTYTKNNKEYFNPTAGIVKGNTTVTMTGGHVVRTVYGGGSMGSVGTFTEADATYHTSHEDVPVGKPYECAENTGLCSVTISGGKIGPTSMSMPNYYGNVFGAGRGEMHDPDDYPNLETSAYFNKTKVLINGNAFVKGSVYGGAESGHVLNDTEVEINGNCQIGCGYDGSTNGAGDLDRVYTAAEWAYDVTTDNTKFLYECNSWPYQAPYTPYDKFADENGKYPDNSSADNAHSTGTDGHTFYGNVFGGGSGSTPYAPGKWLPTAGWVEGNTTVEIKGGHILTSVYGGNEMSDVGAGGVRKMTDLINETADMFYDITKSGGKCTVKMSGGTLGVPRTLAQIAAHPLTCYLFGAGKGDQRIFFNKTTNVKEVEVEVSGGRIYGSVFGGGEDGHVMKNVTMTIKDNAYIGTWGTSYVEGNVFGGGRGFSGEALTAGNVGGCVEINIQGGTMLGSVYGGGRLGSVGYGLYLVDETVDNEQPYGVMRPNNVDDRGNAVSNFNRGYITINISGGIIGNNIEYQANPSATDKQKMPTTTFDSQNHLLYTRGGNVFAGCMGRLYSLENELLPLWPKLGRCRQTTLNITGGTIKSNVYGGAELGVVEQNTSVNITGGQVGTQIGTGSGAYYYGSVFGSGKGSNDNITYPSTTPEAERIPISEAGTTGGNVTVHLNKDVAANAMGGIVRKVFGCNDMNGSPKGDVLVHIHATQSEGTDNIAMKAASGYDVDYVFGGGNNADYVPTETGAKQSTEVIIEGCDLTSIKEVYGGGYGAATPGTNVLIKGTKIIDNLFGGGYGAGDDNPGANVGFRSDGTIEYGNDGKAVVQLMAGTVNHVYGGSNTKGNIRGGSNVTSIVRGSNDLGPACCEKLTVLDIFGGGKSAPMFGGAEIVLGCMPNDWVGAIYGGAEAADVKNDVSLTLTSGKFGRVFGGNKSSGVIEGYIEVNIEENPDCDVPIIIGELYGGGDRAPYNTPDKYLSKDPNYQSPRVNVRAFTSIGNIFGGGYGDEAVVTGNPMVNINEVAGGREYVGDDGDAKKKLEDGTVVEIYKTLSDDTEEGTKVTLYPRYTGGKMGVIGNVFGGGNAAAVVGSTYVNIGTTAEEPFVSLPMIPVVDGNGDPVYEVDQQGKPVYESDGTTRMQKKALQTKPVVGADIRGNVYGGGNNAGVTGDTNVVIGKEKVTTP